MSICSYVQCEGMYVTKTTAVHSHSLETKNRLAHLSKLRASSLVFRKTHFLLPRAVFYIHVRGIYKSIYLSVCTLPFCLSKEHYLLSEHRCSTHRVEEQTSRLSVPARCLAFKSNTMPTSLSHPSSSRRTQTISIMFSNGRSVPGRTSYLTTHLFKLCSVRKKITAISASG